jgi:hypothetical protein
VTLAIMMAASGFLPYFTALCLCPSLSLCLCLRVRVRLCVVCSPLVACTVTAP